MILVWILFGASLALNGYLLIGRRGDPTKKMVKQYTKLLQLSAQAQLDGKQFLAESYIAGANALLDKITKGEAVALKK